VLRKFEQAASNVRKTIKDDVIVLWCYLLLWLLRLMFCFFCCCLVFGVCCVVARFTVSVFFSFRMARRGLASYTMLVRKQQGMLLMHLQ
jgi:hypothetical protein